MPTLIKTIGNRNIGPVVWRNTADSANIGRIDDDGTFVIGIQNNAITHTMFGGVTRIIGGTVGDVTMRIQVGNTTGVSIIDFGDQANDSIGRILYGHSSDTMGFRTAGSSNNYLTIDGSGVVTIGPAVSNTLTHAITGYLGVGINDANTSVAGYRSARRSSSAPFAYLTAGVDSAGNSVADGVGCGWVFEGRTPSNTTITLGNVNGSGAWLFGPDGVNNTHRLNGLTEFKRFSSDTASAIQVSKVLNSTATTNRFIDFGINNGFTNSGVIAANGANAAAFQTTSDARLKTNVQSYSGGLAKLMDIRPVTFEWIAHPGEEVIGFIAQEVEPIIPYAVSAPVDPETEYYSMCRENFIPYMISAIKELKTINDALEARIAALEV